MLQVSGLSKYYGSRALFEKASFSMSSRERVGLIGRNGSGKSTLFKMILGTESYDEGTIIGPKGYKIGHLAQHLKFTKPTILEEACLGLSIDEQELTYKGEIILAGLGFSEEDFYRSPHDFSGGFQIRINLAKLLLSEPDLLLLDEPTNYLDIVSARWLARTLQGWKGELIIVTHDRSFMDSVTTHTMMVYRNGIKKIQGPTQKLYEQIALDEEIYEKTRVNQEKKRKEIEQFVNRFRAKASKASLVQSRVKALERMEKSDALVDEATLSFSFGFQPFHSKTLVEASNLTFGYDENQILIDDLTLTVGKQDRIGIIGKNGRGKSTLLKILSSELKPNIGEVVFRSETAMGYFGQTNIDRLNPEMTVEQEISKLYPEMHRTKVRAICGTMMFEGDDALKKVKVLSGGEKSRVLLAQIIASPTNILFLDEPTNHLDMDSVDSMIESLQSYPGAVVLVTHHEQLLSELCNRLVIFQGDKPFIFEGDYKHFLSKIGWEEEIKDTSKVSKSISVKNSNFLQEKELDKKLKKSRNDSTKIEEKIVTLEAKLQSLQVELQKATESSEFGKINEIGNEIQKIQSQVEGEFSKLESIEIEIKNLAQQLS